MGHWLESILKYPSIYAMVPKILGSESMPLFVSNHIKPEDGMKILDMGCGPGKVLSFLPQKIEYYGFDPNPLYIEKAQQQYGPRGHFLVSNVESFDSDIHGNFDLVMALGVLHHLNDFQATSLMSKAQQCLKPGGRFFSCDPGYTNDQPRIARFLASLDRGEHVRYPEELTRLAENEFSQVHLEVRHDRMKRVPYTHLLMTALKGTDI